MISFDSERFVITEVAYPFLIRERTLFANNFLYNGSNYIVHVTESHINVYDQAFVMKLQIPTVISPLLIKFKKTGQLYIYNKNYYLTRYDLISLCKKIYSHYIIVSKMSKEELHMQDGQPYRTESPYIPEILRDDLQISSFDVTSDMLVYSNFDSRQIFILSLKTNKVEVLCEIESKVFVTSIAFIKSEGIKFLFISLSNGKMLFYKVRCKKKF